jgi:hypothetical protein
VDQEKLIREINTLGNFKGLPKAFFFYSLWAATPYWIIKLGDGGEGDRV